MSQLLFAGRVAVAVLAGSGLSGPSTWAKDVVSGPMKISHPWSPVAPPSSPTLAGYMTISNGGKASDRLIGASSPAFGSIQIHKMSMASGVMSMRPVPEGLVAPAGGSLRLSPDNYHLMLMQPKRAFKKGERIPLTLTFEHTGQVHVELDVETPPQVGAMSAMDAR